MRASQKFVLEKVTGGIVMRLSHVHDFVISHCGDDIIKRGRRSIAAEYTILPGHIVGVPNCGGGVLCLYGEGEDKEYSERQGRE